MKISGLIFFSAFLLLVILVQPTLVFSEADNFNTDGLEIDEDQYEILASERDKNVGMELENGYNKGAGVWKDPIKLRKKRIEQWKQMRSQYNPESLPHKIEK